MSEALAPVSAAGGASFEGPDVKIRDRGVVGMVTIRGDLASDAFRDAVKDATGAAPPDVRGYVPAGDGGLGWMAPDELLFVCPYETAPAAVDKLNAALAGEHHLVVDVSDARAVFRIEGAGARELIAKGAPVDMSPGAFTPGMLRRSRLGQVAAAFWLESDGSLTLVCFRSVGAYVFSWLKNSCMDGARPSIF